jgi:hypothetical protein
LRHNGNKPQRRSIKEMTAAARNRLAIYAKLGIPEVWRFNGESIRNHLLKEDDYIEGEKSLCLPSLPVREMVPFLNPDEQFGDTTNVRRFVSQVRRHFQ